MNELLELTRRAFDSGTKTREIYSKQDEIDSVKETMIISLLSYMQENGKFCIPECIGDPFMDSK